MSDRYNQVMGTIESGLQVAEAIAQPIREKRQNSQWASAFTETQKEFYDLQRELITETDPDEYERRFNEGSGRIYDNVANNMDMDSTVLDRYRNEFGQIKERNRQTVMKVADERRRAQSYVQLQRSLESAEQFPDPDEAESHIRGNIRNAFQDGIIDEQQAYELQREYDGRIMFRAAQREADSIIDDNEGDEAYIQALRFASDPDNGLRSQQRGDLRSYIGQRQQEFQALRQAQTREYLDQADQLLVEGQLTHEFINDRENFPHVEHQERQYLRGLLGDLERSRSETGTQVTEENSDRFRGELYRKIGSQQDWKTVYNQALEWEREGVLTPTHFDQVIRRLEDEHPEHPMNEVWSTFEGALDDLDDISEERKNEARRHINRQLTNRMYETDENGRVIGISEHAPTNEEAHRIAQEILQPFEIEDLNNRDFESFDRTLSGLGNRDGISLTKDLDQGKYRYMRGFDEDFDAVVDQVAEGHEQLIRSLFPEDDSIERERIDDDGLAVFRWNHGQNQQGYTDMRVGYDEETDSLTVRLPDGNGGWSVIANPSIFPGAAEAGLGEADPSQNESETSPEGQIPVGSQSPEEEVESMADRLSPPIMGFSTDPNDVTDLYQRAMTEPESDEEGVRYAVRRIRERTRLTPTEIRIILSESDRVQGVQATQSDYQAAAQFRNTVAEKGPDIVAALQEKEDARNKFVQWRTRNRVTDWIHETAEELDVYPTVVERAYLESDLYEQWNLIPKME